MEGESNYRSDLWHKRIASLVRTVMEIRIYLMEMDADTDFDTSFVSKCFYLKICKNNFFILIYQNYYKIII